MADVRLLFDRVLATVGGEDIAMGRLNERSIRDLLRTLLDSLDEGRTLVAPWPGDSRHWHTGPWRGLDDVVLRCDSVTFWRTKEHPVEAEIGKLPRDEADLVRRIWMFADPALAEAEAIATVVKHHPAPPPRPTEIPREMLVERMEDRLAQILARPLMYGGDWQGVEIAVLDVLDTLDLLEAWPQEPPGESVMMRWVEACREVAPDWRPGNVTVLAAMRTEGVSREILTETLRQAVAVFRKRAS